MRRKNGVLRYNSSSYSSENGYSSSQQYQQLIITDKEQFHFILPVL